MTWFDVLSCLITPANMFRDMLLMTSRPSKSSQKFLQPLFTHLVRSSLLIQATPRMSNIEVAYLYTGHRIIQASLLNRPSNSILWIRSMVLPHSILTIYSSVMVLQYMC
jgi:hypothetical protein